MTMDDSQDNFSWKRNTNSNCVEHWHYFSKDFV